MEGIALHGSAGSRSTGFYSGTQLPASTPPQSPDAFEKEALEEKPDLALQLRAT